MTPRGAAASARKLGLVGCGAIAVSRHIPAIHDAEGLTLHAAFDPSPEARARARQLGIPHVFDSLDALLDSGVDVVSVVSSAPTHLANVLAAAERKLPVLCEKPLATSVAEIESMKNAMERAGTPLYTAFCYRFSPVALRIRALVRDEAIGPVRVVRLVYNWGAHGQRPEDGRRVSRMAEGGPLVDCGTHQIDLARFWLGSEVKSHRGFGAWIGGFAYPDHQWLQMEHANGAHTAVEVSYSYHHSTHEPRSEFVYELIADRGVIRYDRAQRSFTLSGPNGTEMLPYAPEKNFVGMYEALGRALETGEPGLLGTAEDGRVATEIAWGATTQAMRSQSGDPTVFSG